VSSNDLGWLLRLLVLAGFFAACVWGSYRLVLAVQGAVTLRRKLQDVGRSREFQRAAAIKPSVQTWARLVQLVEDSGLSLADSDPDALRAKMIAAGFDSPIAPRLYVLVRLALILVLPLIGCLVLWVTGAEFSIENLYLLALVCVLAVLLGPTWVIWSRTRTRHAALVNGFPNCLDLLLVCVEAGLGLEAAFDRIAREMADAEPEVTKLLVRTTLLLRAGTSREDALRRLGAMSGVTEINAFCTMLIQSERLGASIGSTLRIYAGDMREKRRMRAEEKAHKMPVLISVPLIVCMLPTMLGVLMLPAAIRVVTELLPLIGGK